jgi:Branched-chain amino acid ABC-type transport system, permease components
VRAYPIYRLALLGASIVIGIALWLFLNRTRVGMMIRAGVDDRAMLQASGVNTQRIFAITFALGAGLAGFAGVVGGTALSIAPGEDVRYLLASLVVVIVGGMGSVTGAAIGALLIGLAETIGLAYSPTYGVVYTFLIMVACWRSGPRASWAGRMTAAAANSAPSLALRLGLTPRHLGDGRGPHRYPLLASPFWTVQIGAQILFLGVIALSLMFLAGYGGMVSLSQMTVAGAAGYMIAVIGVNSAHLGLDWPWWAAIPLSIAIAVILALLIGLISVRTGGIYTIMITLAIGVAFFYFTRQNYAIFNGHSGFAGLQPPVLLGINWRDPLPFYYLSLAVAVLSYGAVLYVSRSTFGIALQAIRDNPGA